MRAKFKSEFGFKDGETAEDHHCDVSQRLMLKSDLRRPLRVVTRSEEKVTGENGESLMVIVNGNR